MPWDPELYHKFQQQRALPFEDLFKLIQDRPGMKVVDLGCGTGELTRKLADRLPESDVLGLDSSAEMLGKASPHLRAGLRFEQRKIEELEGQWDLIFSHAALHWVDDHPRFIPRLFARLRPGGQLAVQVPSMHRHCSHTLIAAVAREAPFKEALNGWTRGYPILDIDEYAALFFGLGADSSMVFEKVYPHLLENSDAMADWNIGTAMVPYLERLPNELREQFKLRYRVLMKGQFPEAPLLYPFRRTLLIASAASAK